MDTMRCSAGPRIALPQDLLQDDDSFITRHEPGAKPSLMSDDLPTQGRVARRWEVPAQADLGDDTRRGAALGLSIMEIKNEA
jgi:hypothetical protein